MRVAGYADSQLPEQPRRVGGNIRFVFGGIRFRSAGLGMAFGSGTALLGTGEVEVGAHDMGDARCRVTTLGGLLRWDWGWFAAGGGVAGGGWGVHRGPVVGSGGRCV